MRRILAFVMTMALFITLLMSCDNKQTESNVSDDSSTSTQSSEESGDKVYTADVPDVNYNNLEFKIMTRLKADAKYSEFGFWNEREANTINTAVDKRNDKVEELLGIDIVEVGIIDGKDSSIGTQLRQIANAGVDDYYFVEPQLYEVTTLAAEGLFYNLYDLEYLHALEAEWWDQYFLEETTIADKAFFVTGDVGFDTHQSLTVCYFNKDMIDEFDMENPYELVKNHKWTLDVVIEWSKLVKTDLDNNNIINYKDKFGVGGQNDLMWALFYGNGCRLAEKDNNGIPVVNVYNDKSVSAMDKILKLMNDKNYFVCANDYWGESGYIVSPCELITDAFITNRALFYYEALATAEDLRNADANMEFGILPIPLFDENQDEYQHMLNPWGGNAFAIPRYLGDEKAEIASIVLEVLGAESKNTVTPAVYDIALKQQKTRDIESQEMLDLIFDTISVDVGHIYNWGNMGFSLLHAMIGADVGQFTSLWDGMEDSVNVAVDGTIEAFEALD
ncbi:MAG: hypothetical protein A2Y17_11490 [Clostridiales bacterium GWF2_38_85]|nr:MAG: hypothetical protein A2Y17_11490 [Clostridiales bacterium GWF2_38_85]HBL85096.1 hypothetical protein [Clostridiales bacterium]